MRRRCWRWQSGPLWCALVEFWGVSVSSRINDPGAGIGRAFGWGFSEAGGTVLSACICGDSLMEEHHVCVHTGQTMRFIMRYVLIVKGS